MIPLSPLRIYRWRIKRLPAKHSSVVILTAYRYSDIDRNNLNWMAGDNSCGTLVSVELESGQLRGLTPFGVDFTYPISAIAGENGSGKSTLLAMVACAFHNDPSGYKPTGRARTYCTYSDFFIQSREENPPQGVEVWYQIRLDRWARREPGPGWQKSRKREGGRWSDYAARVNRNVIYFGIQRVVPHYERSAHKSYRGRFRLGTLDKSIRSRIRKIASRIIGKTYAEYEIHKHSKYSLPVAKTGGIRYSGFNMGAGESAVFEILTALFEAGNGTLLVIDEIELGLHERAQRRLIDELKKLCKEFHCQVVCSTHSHVILDTLPPEGRFYIESLGGKTLVTPGISADLACGKLSGTNAGEIDVFVEDGTASSVLEMFLPLSLRERICITPIGSSEAVLRQVAGRYLEKKDNCLAILDGDKHDEHNNSRKHVRTYVEGQFRISENEINKWIDNRLGYLPGDTWPEKWLIETALEQNSKEFLAAQWGSDEVGRIERALEDALNAGRHREFFTLQNEIQQPLEQVRADVIRFVKQAQPDALDVEIAKIEELL